MRYSQEKIQKAKEMAKLGAPRKVIAKKLKMDAQAVGYHTKVRTKSRAIKSTSTPAKTSSLTDAIKLIVVELARHLK